MASLISSSHRRSAGQLKHHERASTARSAETVITIAFLVSLLILGGTSADGAITNLGLELLSLLVLLVTILLTGKLRPMAGSRGLTTIVIFLVFSYALQLVPLPPQLWAALPGRELIVRGYDLLNVPLPWRPLSFSSERTIASAAALLPGICAISLVLRTPREHFQMLGYTVVAVSTLSVLFGIFQIVDGEGSGLYWHNVRAGVSAQGFFANSNHLSTLLLMTMPLLFAAAKTALKGHAVNLRLSLSALGAIGLFLIFGILASQSTGGLVLLVPTLLASSFLLIRSQSESKFGLPRRRAIIAGLAALIAVSVPFALVISSSQQISWGSSLGFGELERLGIARTTTAAALELWPFGSGMGSFPLVYPAHEDPLSVSNVFINHAHNDYLELLFESGILGVVLIGGVFAWWVHRTIKAWRADDEFAPWAQAASIALAVLAVHSEFDYPARTPAILTFGAVLCAILGRYRHSEGGGRPVPAASRNLT